MRWKQQIHARLALAGLVQCMFFNVLALDRSGENLALQSAASEAA